MDTNNWRPIQGGEPTMDTTDWRTQFQHDWRQRVVNKIMDTLKKHLPFSGQEGLLELKKIAERFEEKIYSTATSQTDYLRKISLKMLTMEPKSQNNNIPNPLPSNPVNSRPTDPGRQYILKCGPKNSVLYGIQNIYIFESHIDVINIANLCINIIKLIL
ncbi:mediator of RNA polymerase II transcription subunit 15a isoform X1 [Cannabis sativa]|uniref:mediator of RNA polymerase II transcription subunit 15a isoform X1 n=1 Tax=Cannabis sativa TaxID=3483 RepID=UPI0029C9E096|nr:mediator of RNA polymerase II transcription subunit 15a isoform X1 [Cannabis sativa]XP_060959314.1 mediator of RNA polymerase II transcription subunit 15a isoform X1 [Cannabis sativa]